MCFWAGASFGASVVLSIIGTAAIMKARTIPQGLFAGIPVLFSIQQLAEGMLWLSSKNFRPRVVATFFYLYISCICFGGLAHMVTSYYLHA